MCLLFKSKATAQCGGAKKAKHLMNKGFSYLST